MKKNLLLASTSTVHGSGYLNYLKEELLQHFEKVNEILFIPFARPGGISHNSYTEKTIEFFNSIGKSVRGLHEFENKPQAVEKAKGIFTGGGNTFVLLSQLYHHDLMQTLMDVLNNGTPYLGTSAGTNICGQTIGTTNDMPIEYPPSFDALALVPFNINPHYLDPDPNSTHMGETREVRITEFHKFNDHPVIGLREGSYLHVEGDRIFVKGPHTCRIFKANQTPFEHPTNQLLKL